MQLSLSCSPELDEVHPGQEGAEGPLGDLAAVVLQLRCQDSASLGLQLLPPVHSTRQLQQGGWGVGGEGMNRRVGGWVGGGEGVRG